MFSITCRPSQLDFVCNWLQFITEPSLIRVD
jgi:hypothetical protein